MQRKTRTRVRSQATDGGSRRGRLGCVSWIAVLALWAPPAIAQPRAVDLADPTPRWIAVSFETSPYDRPGRLRARFSPSFRAWLEPGPRDDQIRVTVPSQVVEAHLLGQHEPVPGSFSDFVWIFDASSGHVLSASLSGEVVNAMDLGWMQTRTVTRMSMDIDSRRVAGFRPSSRMLGNEFFRYCAERESQRCEIVPGAPLDPSSGYVNAVGAIAATTGPFAIRSFSPMGEALFREGSPDEPRLPDVAAGPFQPTAAPVGGPLSGFDSALDPR